MTDRTMPQASDYRPYDELLAFTQGADDYQLGRHKNPFGNSSVNAQAWDRGHCYQSQVEQFCYYLSSR